MVALLHWGHGSMAVLFATWHRLLCAFCHLPCGGLAQLHRQLAYCHGALCCNVHSVRGCIFKGFAWIPFCIGAWKQGNAMGALCIGAFCHGRAETVLVSMQPWCWLSTMVLLALAPTAMSTSLDNAGLVLFQMLCCHGAAAMVPKRCWGPIAPWQLCWQWFNGLICCWVFSQ